MGDAVDILSQREGGLAAQGDRFWHLYHKLPAPSSLKECQRKEHFINLVTSPHGPLHLVLYQNSESSHPL